MQVLAVPVGLSMTASASATRFGSGLAISQCNIWSAYASSLRNCWLGATAARERTVSAAQVVPLYIGHLGATDIWGKALQLYMVTREAVTACID